MKTFKTKLLTIALLLCSISASAYDFEVDGIYYNITSSENLTVEVTYKGRSYNSYSDEYTGDVVIPDSVTYGDVTYSVTKIGEYAFYESNLLSLSIPKNVTSVGYYAFKDCTGTLILNANIKSGCFAGYNGVFNYSKFDNLIIGDNVNFVDFDAFRSCNSLTSVHINSLESWCNISFGNTEANPLGCAERLYLNGELVTELSIPSTLSIIKDYTFYHYDSLTSIIIPEGVKSIGIRAFAECGNLTSVIISKSVTDIGNAAFASCDSLTSIEIPEGVTNIGKQVFWNCKKLSSITISGNLTSIGNDVFQYTSIVKTIWKCSKLPTGYKNAKGLINYIADEKYASYEDFKVYPLLNSLFEKNGIIYVPTSLSERTCDIIDCIEDNKMVHLTIDENVSFKGVEMNIKDINSYTFYGNTNIEDVILKNSGSLGKYAFYGCESLSSITLGNSISSIESYAFGDCNTLTTFTLPSSVTSVGCAIFSNCSNLKNIIVDINNIVYDSRDNSNAIIEKNTNTLITACNHTVIPESVKIIGDYAFSGCKNIINVNIPDNVKSIGRYAFNDCTSLLTIKLSNGVTSIGEYAFRNCAALQELSIPQSIVNIFDYAFVGCSALSDIIIQDRTTELILGSNGTSALFNSCPLDSVYIGGKITYNASSSKGYSPFYKNITLRTVSIANKEDKIYNNQFYGCTSLTNVAIGDGVTSIGDNAFFGCSSLTAFKFGSSMKTIGAYAFADCANMKEIISSAVTPPLCGTLALDDINKWECVLKVPISSLSSYMEADQWNEFLFIEDVMEIERYALTFIVDGKIYSSDSLAYSEIVILPDTPEKAGHTFSGWSEVPATMPANDVTIEGKFTVNAYSLTYMVDGEVYATKDVTYGSAITLMDAPTKEGHTFSGWSEIPETMPAEDVTVVGQFTINTYQLAYIVDGKVYATMQIQYGSPLYLIANPTKEGFIFSGWSEIPETMPAHDVEVTGEFTSGINTITVGNNSPIYNLQGVQMRGTKENLPGGIYIQNGKKFAVK